MVSVAGPLGKRPSVPLEVGGGALTLVVAPQSETDSTVTIGPHVLTGEPGRVPEELGDLLLCDRRVDLIKLRPGDAMRLPGPGHLWITEGPQHATGVAERLAQGQVRDQLLGLTVGVVDDDIVSTHDRLNAPFQAGAVSPSKPLRIKFILTAVIDEELISRVNPELMA